MSMRKTTSFFKPKYEYLPDIDPIKESVLFFDIETTGFTYKSANLYMIGVASFKENRWELKQWLIESPEEEKDLLLLFDKTASNYSTLVHFNGNQFDLPFLLGKYKQYGLNCCLSLKEGIDLYQRISPFKSLLGIRSSKQRTLEEYMGDNRFDQYSGGELINVFHDFLKDKTEACAQKLLLHNAEDVKGMLDIAPLLSLYHLFSDDLKVSRVYTETYHSVAAHLQKELFIKFKLTEPLHKEFDFKFGGCMFKGEGHNGLLRIPMHQGELKYFYANYKDYYYLPEEDMAIHKSVAVYADKSHREQAKASNCYTRLNSEYLPQWSLFTEPIFKTAYDSKQTFFELTDTIKKDRHFFSKYVTHVLEMMLVTSKKREG